MYCSTCFILKVMIITTFFFNYIGGDDSQWPPNKQKTSLKLNEVLQSQQKVLKKKYTVLQLIYSTETILECLYLTPLTVKYNHHNKKDQIFKPFEEGIQRMPSITRNSGNISKNSVKKPYHLSCNWLTSLSDQRQQPMHVSEQAVLKAVGFNCE